MSGLPSIVFGLAALGPAFLALLLPDTSRAPLPGDLADAENIDKMVADDSAGDTNTGEVTLPIAIVIPSIVIPPSVITPHIVTPTVMVGQKE